MGLLMVRKAYSTSDITLRIDHLKAASTLLLVAVDPFLARELKRQIKHLSSLSRVNSAKATEEPMSLFTR